MTDLEKATGFTKGSDVVVKELDDVEWELRSQITYVGNQETFDVPIGQRTDFASVPRIFIWFLPRYGRYTKAAILHDYLWRVRADAKQDRVSWADADALFCRAMRDLNVPFLRRWIMWGAVTWAAMVKKDGLPGVIGQWWRLALVTLLAFPIVFPPAVLIVVGLFVFHVLELATWGLLAMGRAIGVLLARREPEKRLVRPRLEFKV